MIRKKLAIAIPASVIADTPHLREKTSKIGYIGRAAAIFCVNEIIVYADNSKINQTKDIDLIALLLGYMETPQYLRKRLFEIKPELQYAGIMPPLRTPHHPLTGGIRDLKIGMFRECVALSKSKEGTLVDIGSERPAVLPQVQVAFNTRLTVKINKINDRIEVQIANKDGIPDYWGYSVSNEKKSLGALLRSRDFDLTIGTSKAADRFQDVANALTARWKKAARILLLFGAPTRGLFEILKDENVNLKDTVDFVLNMVPNQGTETVRTEEALLASLAIFNLQFDFLK